jgi:signal transduction histidine kinase
MGLGLFLTRTVIERVGGELELESREGLGTRALVRLPRGTTAALVDPAPAKKDRMDEAGPI